MAIKKEKIKRDTTVNVVYETKMNYDKFKEIYEKDRFLARIFALSKDVKINEIIVFTHNEDAFEIIDQTKTFSVTTNLKAHASKKINRVIYVKKNVVYFKSKTIKIRPFVASDLSTYDEPIMIKKFPFIRFMKENLITLSVNTVIKYKLYTLKKCLAKQYGIPYPQALKLRSNLSHETTWDDDHNTIAFISCQDVKLWNSIKKGCVGLENINEDIIKAVGNTFFTDTIKMAHKLNTKVNLSWSVKRFTEEHDKYAMLLEEYTVGFDNEILTINKIFKEFEDYSSIYMFKTTGELSAEGIKKHHCVGGYASYVNSGDTAIYSYEEYTLQISKNYGSDSVFIRQFKGYRNVNNPDKETVEKVQKIVDYFNHYKIELSIQADTKYATEKVNQLLGLNVNTM